MKKKLIPLTWQADTYNCQWSFCPFLRAYFQILKIGPNYFILNVFMDGRLAYQSEGDTWKDMRDVADVYRAHLVDKHFVTLQ